MNIILIKFIDSTVNAMFGAYSEIVRELEKERKEDNEKK